MKHVSWGWVVVLIPILRSLVFVCRSVLFSSVVNSAYNNDKGKYSEALDFAIREHKGNEIIKLLIENGADVNKINQDRNSPLHTYLEQKEGSNLEIVKLLINKGNINSENLYKSTVLDFAIKKQGNEIIKLLIENGADVNKSASCHGAPLKLAIMKGDYDKVKLLIENGASLFDKEGNSYLYYYLNFTQNPNVEIVKTIIEKDIFDSLKYLFENNNYDIKLNPEFIILLLKTNIMGISVESYL